jgi:hypothetical protein
MDSKIVKVAKRKFPSAVIRTRTNLRLTVEVSTVIGGVDEPRQARPDPTSALGNALLPDLATARVDFDLRRS